MSRQPRGRSSPARGSRSPGWRATAPECKVFTKLDISSRRQFRTALAQDSRALTGVSSSSASDADVAFYSPTDERSDDGQAIGTLGPARRDLVCRSDVGRAFSRPMFRTQTRRRRISLHVSPIATITCATSSAPTCGCWEHSRFSGSLPTSRPTESRRGLGHRLEPGLQCRGRLRRARVASAAALATVAYAVELAARRR